MQNAPEKQALPVSSGLAVILVLVEDLWRSTRELRYKRRMIRTKHVSISTRLGDKVSFKTLILFSHKSLERKLPSANNIQNSRKNFIKKPVTVTLDESISLKAGAKESCRVPKTTLHHDESPLLQRAANFNDTGMKSLKLALISMIQYQQECTLPESISSILSTKTSEFSKIQLFAFAVGLTTYFSDEMSRENKTYSADVLLAHAANITVGRSNKPRLNPILQDLCRRTRRKKK